MASSEENSHALKMKMKFCSFEVIFTLLNFKNINRKSQYYNACKLQKKKNWAQTKVIKILLNTLH
jgi:hypothetical protein